MTAQLSELYGNMEGKIQEKAAALEDGVSKLKTAEAQAENQSSLLRSLVDNLPVGVVVMKAPKGETIVLNRMGAEFLTRGIDPNLTKDDYANAYHFMTEDGQPYPPKELPIIKTLETGMAQSKEGIVVTRVDQSKVTLRVSAAPVKDAYGNLLFVVATLEDMAVERKNAPKHQLAAFVVHNEPLDVGVVADGVIKQWESSIAAKHIVLQKEYAADVPLVSGDAKLLRAVLSNIIGNAVNYTPDGGAVNVSITKNDINILIVIKDTGTGIPVQDQKYIFNALFRDDNIQKYGVNGNGFGLYMVRSIMDQVGGTVHFESAEGAGSTFYVTIPLTGMKEH
jgi:signal transduction histidine kinase